MTSYIVRRVIQGFLVLVASSFVIYSILVVTPGGPVDQYYQKFGEGGHPPPGSLLEALLKLYKLDKPYPINYLVWLFDPEDTTEIVGLDKVVPKGLDLAIGPWHIKGSGVLTGDFGRSVSLAKGVYVMDMIGIFASLISATPWC